VCAVGLLVVVALAYIGRPHHGSDPAASHLAVGASAATPSGPGSPAATPGGGVSPSPAPARLTSTAPRPATTSSPTRTAPSPRTSPSTPAAPSSAPIPPPYLRLNPASGAATLTPPPTWSASACPSGFQGSAVLFELYADGSIASSISNVVGDVTVPFSGTLDGSVKALITFAGVSPGGTSQWKVGCFAGIGGTGAQQLGQAVYVTLSADGSSYTSSASPPS